MWRVILPTDVHAYAARSWIGQTTASLCWIISVFAYGLSEPGDYLQLSAASAWLIANIASVAMTTTECVVESGLSPPGPEANLSGTDCAD